MNVPEKLEKIRPSDNATGRVYRAIYDVAKTTPHSDMDQGGSPQLQRARSHVSPAPVDRQMVFAISF